LTRQVKPGVGEQRGRNREAECQGMRNANAAISPECGSQLDESRVPAFARRITSQRNFAGCDSGYRRRLLESIGNVPPAELETMYYHFTGQLPMAV
jgi:hypothetical protein